MDRGTVSIFSAAFAKAATERAVKTFAQTLAALLVADYSGLIGVDWAHSLSVAGLAALVSILTSVGSGAATGHGPSLANEYTVPTDLG